MTRIGGWNRISTMRLPKTVLILGLVSFFTDLSSEMIYPLLPLFLSSVLGSGAVALGVIEGFAESTASIFKLLSGIWADRCRRRKPFILCGYGISGMVRPMIGLATVWPVVLGIRFVDRLGKGLRTSPRDALIADAVSIDQRGEAYGFHRAMDHAGAVVGPLAAAALLGIGGMNLRLVFIFSIVPALIVVGLVIFGIKEPGRIEADTLESTVSYKGHWQSLGKDFKWMLAAILVFTLGNSSDAFILLHLSKTGLPSAWIAVLWSAHHVVKMASTYTGGRVSDRFGRRKPVICGWLIYGVIYFLFGMTENFSLQVLAFLAYGLYFGFTEPSEKAWVADLVPPHLRGTAFGYYHMVVGLGALPASLFFGFLWQRWGVSTAFITGALLAAAASLLLFLIGSEKE